MASLRVVIMPPAYSWISLWGSITESGLVRLPGWDHR